MILIVDDNTLTVRLLQRLLHSEGYDTLEAYDGEECLEKIEKHRPDLIILDVMMPKLDGCGVCKRLKTGRNTMHIPIVILTAKGDMPDKIKGLDIGADDYITKPFHWQELLARVRSLLAKRTSNERLIEEEKLVALERMTEEVSHEIINPLVSVGGFARHVYKSLPEGSQNKKHMEIVLNGVGALEKLVQELVKLKSATVSYLETTNINQIILEALDAFGQEIEKNNIDVKTSLMPLPPSILADSENLKRAIANIIENAVEAMQSETRVMKISTQAREDCFEIQISDTGQGVSRDRIKSIFDPFFTSKIYGPGLGLTFSLKTIQSHRGMISVESEEGMGTTFNISLPMRQSSSLEVRRSSENRHLKRVV